MCKQHISGDGDFKTLQWNWAGHCARKTRLSETPHLCMCGKAKLTKRHNCPQLQSLWVNLVLRGLEVKK